MSKDEQDRIAEVVAELEALDGKDGEYCHAEADRLILAFVPAEVADAYDRAEQRAKFWAYS